MPWRLAIVFLPTSYFFDLLATFLIMKLLGHLSAALLLLGTASLVNAQTNTPRPDPFVDPAHDPYNPLKYIASNTLTAISFCAFSYAVLIF